MSSLTPKADVLVAVTDLRCRPKADLWQSPQIFLVMQGLTIDLLVGHRVEAEIIKREEVNG